MQSTTLLPRHSSVQNDFYANKNSSGQKKNAGMPKKNASAPTRNSNVLIKNMSVRSRKRSEPITTQVC